MLSVLAALLAASQPALPRDRARLGQTAWLVATVGHSEFCPAGNVRLDLRTGRFQFTARAPRRRCNDPALERPVRVGMLAAAPLRAIRDAYLRVRADGLVNPACENGGRPDEIVVSNGGTPLLVVATGATTGVAPENLTCWSDAASALQQALDAAFPSDG
jgi:hypothetical protein